MAAASPFTVRKFLFVFIIAWLALITDHAVLLTFYDLPLHAAVLDSVISNGLLLATCLLLMHSIRFYVPDLNQYMNVVVMCIVFTILWLLLARWLLDLIIDYNDINPGFLKKSLVIRASIGFLVLGITTTTAIIWYNWQEQKANDIRKSDADKLAREAELFKLRQQLQPHFLFNSLNSINALIGSRPQEARKMVQQLSDFLRGTIKKEDTQWISLQEEMQYLQLYLEIEKVRFGNRLTTTIEMTDDASAAKIPALLLQPLVENAIKFGLYDTIGETVIQIQTRLEDQQLIVSVSNPFDPETSSPRRGTGFGLSSIKRRLYLLFARNDLLTTQVNDNIFTTEVMIPQHITNPL